MKNKLLYLYTICVNLIILIKEIFTKDSEKQEKMNHNVPLWIKICYCENQQNIQDIGRKSPAKQLQDK